MRAYEHVARMHNALGVTDPASEEVAPFHGPPRSGKSSIASAIQNTFNGVWMYLGVDGFIHSR